MGRLDGVMKIIWILILLLLVPLLGSAVDAQDAELLPAYSDADSLDMADSSSIDTLMVITDGGKIKKIVKRDFNANEQVLVGTLVMTFVIVILTTVANWNPS